MHDDPEGEGLHRTSSRTATLATTSDLPASSEVVVIGGGVHGCSIAYRLAQRGAEVTLVEQEHLAWGASGRNAGMGGHGSRYTRTTDPFTKASYEILLGLPAELGRDVELVQSGGLHLVVDPAEAATLADDDPDAPVLSGDEARVRIPALGPAVLAADYSPKSVHFNPMRLTTALGVAAARCGAHVCIGTRVTGIRVADGRIQAVETTRGVIRARWVVNAANGWAAEIGAVAAVRLPIAPHRGQILVTAPLPPLLPVTLGLMVAGAPTYWRQTPGGQVVMGGGRTLDRPGLGTYHRRTTAFLLPRIARHVLGVVPGLAGAPIVRAWAGIMGFTPDYRPCIGEVGSPRGFVVCAGFNGSGFSWAPLTGRLIAGLIAGESTPLPMDLVHPERSLPAPGST